MKFTQKMMVHLNGGSKFSILEFQIFCDGKPTGITRSRTTNGSPRYEITSDVFRCGRGEFDLMKQSHADLQKWLETNAVSDNPKGDAEE
jgi:hypothetical protein